MRLVRPVEMRHGPTAVIIGGSTGAAAVVHRILSEIPGDLPACILVALDLPAGLCGTFATRLDARCALAVRIARSGTVTAPGTVWLAPDGCRLGLKSHGGLCVVSLADNWPEDSESSVVDSLFMAAAARIGPRALGVVLSGMGHDGVEGAAALCHAGADVLVQDPWSATAWGMPGEVVRQGYATQVVTPGLLAAEIVRRVRGPGDLAAAS